MRLMAVALSLPFSREHIRPGDRLCVAISGGADSVALLLTLHAANTTMRDSLGVGLSAVHVNHHLRGEESDADQRFVEDLCISFDIPLHIHQAGYSGSRRQHERVDLKRSREMYGNRVLRHSS